MTHSTAQLMHDVFGDSLDAPRIAQLTQIRFIRASGPDARSFLQGQVTCDTQKICTTHAVRGALCNLKGRVIADFLALQLGDDILLQVQASVAEKALAVLKKYAVFSKLVLSLDASVRAYGLLIPTPATASFLERFGSTSGLTTKGEAATVNGSALIKSHASLDGAAVFEVWTGEPSLESVEGIDNMSVENWTEIEYRNGLIHIEESTSEEYTPALLNYDINGIVDFKKGCYTGQEIVARMFYRSTPKKRLFALVAANALGATAEFTQAPLSALTTDASEVEYEQALACAGRTLLALLSVDAKTQHHALKDGSPLELIEFVYE